MFDGAVLAGRIHRLEHEQQRPAILGVEDVLLLSASHWVPKCSRSAASLFSRFRPAVSPGSKSFSPNFLPLVMRNGWTYFSIHSRTSFFAMAQTPFRRTEI